LGLGFPGPPAAEAVPLFGGFVPPVAAKDAVVVAVMFAVVVVLALVVVFVVGVVFGVVVGVVFVVAFAFAFAFVLVVGVGVVFVVAVVFALAAIAATGAVELSTTTGPSPCPRKNTRLPPAMTSAPATAAPRSPARPPSVDHAAA
jgi:hypothetical protein